MFSTTYGAGRNLGSDSRMKAPWAIVVAALVALPSYAGTVQDQPPKFRSSVDIVSINAVVRDRKGEYRDVLEELRAATDIITSDDPRTITSMLDPSCIACLNR